MGGEKKFELPRYFFHCDAFFLLRHDISVFTAMLYFFAPLYFPLQGTSAGLPS